MAPFPCEVKCGMEGETLIGATPIIDQNLDTRLDVRLKVLAFHEPLSRLSRPGIHSTKSTAVCHVQDSRPAVSCFRCPVFTFYLYPICVNLVYRDDVGTIYNLSARPRLHLLPCIPFPNSSSSIVPCITPHHISKSKVLVLQWVVSIKRMLRCSLAIIPPMSLHIIY